VKKEAEAGAEPKDGKDKEAESEVLDPAKKDLEAKDKEILDLKVRATSVYSLRQF